MTLRQEADLWAGAAQAHLSQARAGIATLAKLDRKIDAALAEVDRLVHSTDRNADPYARRRGRPAVAAAPPRRHRPRRARRGGQGSS